MDVNMDSSDDDVPIVALKKKSVKKEVSSTGSSALKLEELRKKKQKQQAAAAAAAKVPAARFVTDFSSLRKKKKKKPKKEVKVKAPKKEKVKKQRKKVKREERDDDDDDDDDFVVPDDSSPPRKKRRSSSSTDKPKKKAARKKAPAKRARKKSDATPKEAKKKERKELTWAQKVDRAIMAYKWWEAEKLADGARWRSLEHCGVIFPPPYEPHGIKLLYDGEPVDLTPEQEELATFYAGIAPDGPQLSKPKIAKLFNKNFFNDFKQVLGKGHTIKKFELCDFTLLREYLESERTKRKNRTKEEKAALKEANQATRAKYMYAFVDGHIEKLGNCMVEPPNLFRGRGEHPKTGTFKRRVMPESIMLNIAKDAPVPRCPIPGHAWKNVIHDPTVTWLATWTENVMQQHKYVFLAASSGFKGESDLNKYEKARMLKDNIDSIRKAYVKMLKTKGSEPDADLERQIGIAMWVIDVLALRVGNEKDEDEADTVGCCSLRVEHLTINHEEEEITFDFLGKDSMRYLQTVQFGEKYGAVGKLVFKTIVQCCKGKKPTEEVLDQLTPTQLNNRLTKFMPGLSAKVFRTYNASVTLEQTLRDLPITATTQMKGVVYDDANREVAVLCNHQRTVSKAFQKNFSKLEGRLAVLTRQVKELRQHLAKVKKGDTVPTKSDTDDKERQKLESHLFSRQPSELQLTKRIATFKHRRQKLELNMKQKDDNKTVALGTAKINYMDPRITVAWCKRVSCPIEKVFSRALRDKFPWAMSAPADWKF